MITTLHRTARLNEYSGRYSEMPQIYYTPEQENCGFQSKSNKQGRTDTGMSDETYTEYKKDIVESRKGVNKFYKKWLDQGLAKELARTELPLSIYTYMYWQIDLHNLFHLLKLRLHPHAQYEIREFARVLGGFAKLVAPMAFEAFEDYQLYSQNFSFEEMNYLKARLDDSKIKMSDYNLSQREVDELSHKLFGKVEKHDFDLNLENARNPEFYEQLIRESL